MDQKNVTTKQLAVLLFATLAEFVWVCLPGYGLAIVAALFDTPSDGALGKQYGLLLVLLSGFAMTLLWAPTALKISGPLAKKLIKRVCGTDEEE